MKTELTPWGLCLLFLCIIALLFTAFSQIGCASIPTTPTDPNITFAETAQNVIQTVNNGLKIAAPIVATAATVAQLEAHTPQQQAIFAKIIQVSTAVSATAVAQGLPPAAVQAAVSAVNTPETAAAIVAQTTPSTSMLKFHPDMHPRPREGWICWENIY